MLAGKGDTEAAQLLRKLKQEVHQVVDEKRILNNNNYNHAMNMTHVDIHSYKVNWPDRVKSETEEAFWSEKNQIQVADIFCRKVDLIFKRGESGI